jgi:DNA repair exonuclease SbcCD ATPase subunit
MPARIVRFVAKNYKCLHAIEITPDPETHKVVLAGRNRQGKSSVFDALRAVLFGKRAFAQSPIRNGASQAEASVELDNGLKIELVIKQGDHKIKVTQNGKKPEGTAAAILKSLVSDVCADPMKLAEMEEKDLLAQIRSLCGLNTADLEKTIKDAYDRRTDVNRDAKSLRARLEALPPKHEDAPVDEVSVTDLMEELKRLGAARTTNASARSDLAQDSKQLDALRNKSIAAREKVEEINRQIQELKVRLESACAADDLAHDQENEYRSRHDKWKAEVAKLKDPDTSGVESRISAADETNRKVRQNAARKALEKELSQKEQDASALTQLIEDKEQEKKARLATVKMPVPGLTLDGDSLFLDGAPFTQASHSQKMELCVALAARINPELAVLLVEQAYCCDEQTLQSLYDIARNHEPPLDIWLETLTPTAGAFVIEAGEVSEIVAED